MNEHPILFKGDMVRAILEGRKTQTRRVIRPQPDNPDKLPIVYADGAAYNGNCAWSKNGLYPDPFAKCPYGESGDRLWVREAFCLLEYDRNTFMGQEVEKLPKEKPDNVWLEGDPEFDNDYALLFGANGMDESCRYRPSIHMPRWASRIRLEVLAVRVERVQEITLTDVKAEGLKNTGDGWGPEGRLGSVAGFEDLWDSINSKRGFRWHIDPWVWVVEFKRIPNE